MPPDTTIAAVALQAEEVPPAPRKTFLPEPFATRLAGRSKRRLGDAFGLANFGVNLTVIDPGGQTSMLHRHSKQDEFVYILSGHPTLVTDSAEIPLGPGRCAGFPADGPAHQLVNRTDEPVSYLEVGNRTAGDVVSYPADDLVIVLDTDGRPVIRRGGTEPAERGRPPSGAPIAIVAAVAPPRTRPSNYPEPFASRMARRIKRPLGDALGLANFGVNLTTLKPGGESALLHRHSRQDEFVYILSGCPTLVTDTAEMALAPGMCAGFPAGGIAHHLVNRTDEHVTYLEIGDRTPGDAASYPADDLAAALGPDGAWIFTRKDGTPY